MYGGTGGIYPRQAHVFVLTGGYSLDRAQVIPFLYKLKKAQGAFLV